MPQRNMLNLGEVLRAFKAYEGQERIRNTKVGCALVVTLMPAGSTLDYFVYPDYVWPFLQLRIICSVIAGIIWALLFTDFGQRFSKGLGVVVPLLPVVFIAQMIAVTQGFNSPYYAGLNLVVLAVGAVLRWTFWESVLAVSLVLPIYLAAGLWHGGPTESGILFNNLYFILLMDVIVVVGTWFQYRQRFREFSLRFELDQNRRALEESNRKLTELDQIKSRFFANISHELRTPLTLLLTPLEALLHRSRRAFDEETRSVLLTMRSNGLRLLKLINDLLDLVRLESGRMEVQREPVALPEFLHGLANAAKPMADGKRLRLETLVDPALGTVLTDRDKLEKIVLNLLFNALKFTPAGGRVSLRGEKQADQLVLAVQDTGVGISAQNLPHVFDRFWQADDSSRRRHHGTGIGLALVKELVEIQQGSVVVESQEGRGTTFTVRLPFLKVEIATTDLRPAPSPARAAAEAAAPGGAATEELLARLYRQAQRFAISSAALETASPGAPPGNGDGATPAILIADDEPDMLRFLKSQLKGQYRVVEAADGAQAVATASRALPDLVLLDMMMPEKDGLQVCRELREHPPTRNIPIILLTARADEETKLAALSAGASDFLSKPFSTTELHVRVRNLVESYGYQRKLARQNQALETALKRLKEKTSLLVQTEKMASLGRWSAGMLHEISNPLNFATTGLYTLRQRTTGLAPASRAEYAEVINDIEEGLVKVKSLLLDLRKFCYHDDSKLEQVDVRDLVATSLRFLAHELRDRVRVELDLPEGQTLWANRNKLTQVVVNLLQNSSDALRSKTFDGEAPCIRIEGRVARGRSLLIVRDNGPGIAPEHQDKIFDPFFTTKDVGEGMGLGLSICYGIVQEYGGRIAVKSEPGRFCEFTLDFPVQE